MSGERWALTDLSAEPVMRWNEDRKRRCPRCDAVTVDAGLVTGWAVYECCRCRQRFCSRPWLARVMPFAGRACSEHAGRPEGDPDGRIVHRTGPLTTVSAAVVRVSEGGSVLLRLYDDSEALVMLWDIEGAR